VTDIAQGRFDGLALRHAARQSGDIRYISSVLGVEGKIDEITARFAHGLILAQVSVESGMKYVVVIEEGANSFGAYLPDLPGCVVVGETREEALQLIREAVELHITSLREQGDPVPQPTSTTDYVQV
jgi:predicted RNase H-like HicB family nuclease